MKKRILFIVIFLLSGFIYSIFSWRYFYQTFANPYIFRELSTTEQRNVLKKMTAHQKFSDIEAWLRRTYPEEEPSAHSVGHLLGEVAYGYYGNKAFALCDTIFNYGCYHGVVDMAIRTKGTPSSLPKDLWEACRQEMKDPSPCIHPLGHASTIVAQYDILSAFQTCNALYPEPNVAFFCWNGAMMEYINRSAPNAPHEPYGDPNNPYAPCNSLPAIYEASCVSMHVSYLFSLWGKDFSKLLSYCQTFSRAETVDGCIDAVGAIVAQTYFSSPQRIVDSCTGAGIKVPLCILGAVVPIITARQAQTAQTLCATIDSSAYRTVCYDKIESIFSSNN